MKNFWKEWGGTFLTLLLIVLSWLFIWVNVQVDGHSMDPTLTHGDRLFVLKVTPIDRFDVVVAKETDQTGQEKKIVKRVIGLPGDTITYKNDVLFINDEIVEETYLKDYLEQFQADKLQKTYQYNSFFQQEALNSDAFTTMERGQVTEFSVTMAEDEYYLLGDNRIISSDSREVGNFNKKDIIGEVIFRFWPLKSIGSVDKK